LSRLPLTKRARVAKSEYAEYKVPWRRDQSRGRHVWKRMFHVALRRSKAKDINERLMGLESEPE
jgi:hypothetical protein